MGEDGNDNIRKVMEQYGADLAAQGLTPKSFTTRFQSDLIYGVYSELVGWDNWPRPTKADDLFFSRLHGGQHTTPENKRPSGRPHYPENVWAREQVAMGRDKGEVFEGWYERRKTAGRDPSTLADPLDSFKKAIKPPKPK